MKRTSTLLMTLVVFAVASVSSPPSWGLESGAAVEAVSSLPNKAHLGEVAKRWKALGFTTHIVDVNGERLHIAEAGRGDLIVFLHGYPQSGEVWRFVAPEFAKHHHVVIPDLRGMGLSAVAIDGYDLANVAEDIHQLVRSFGYGKAMVVGHDWGGSVGAVYAMRYRDEVTRLVFLESALPGGGFEDLWTFSKPNDGFTFIPFLLMAGPDSAHDTTTELLAGRESVFLRHLWGGFTGDKEAAPFKSWRPYVQAMARPGVAKAGASYYRAAYRSAEEVRSLEAVPLTIPVLSIAGAKGIGAKQEAFVKAFASEATFVVVPDAGHFVAEERPAEVAAALRGFLGD